jgi:hypothetical protein
MAKDAKAVEPNKVVENQAKEQTGQRQVQLRIDESKLDSTYANAFRTNGTPEEIILDFGLNLAGQANQQGVPEIVFQAKERVIMNYFSAKRLAVTLSQIIRGHEERFGVLELDVAKRQKV